MDARPTPEQRELDDAAIRLAEKLGPTAVGDLDDADRRDRLDAALVQAGWRELRTGTLSEPLASGVEAALVARSLARGACDVAFLGPVLAHDLLRRSGGAALDDATRTVAVTADLSGVARGSGIAIDAAGSSAALALDVTGNTVVEVAIVPNDDANEVDLTRRTSALAPDAGPSLGTLAPDDLRIDEDAQVVLVFAHVDDDDLPVHVDLRGGQADTRCRIHRLRHVVDQLAGRRVDFFDAFRGRAEARVRVLQDLEKGHKSLLI